MAAASSSYGARRGRSTTRAGRRGGGAAAAAARVRWDRLGRAAMLCVLVALVYLYLSAGVRMLSTWRQSRHDGAQVVAMEREHRTLVRQHERLTQPGMLEAQARQLGMMKKDEQPYVVSGLPND